MYEEEKITFRLKSMEKMLMRATFSMIHSVEGDNMMPPMHGWVMNYLYLNRDKEIYQKDVELAFHVARSTVTNIVQYLEKMGYIERIPGEKDSRLKRLVLLPKGEECQEKIHANLALLEEEMRKDISEEELAIFFKVSDKIKDNLKGQIHKDEIHVRRCNHDLI